MSFLSALHADIQEEFNDLGTGVVDMTLTQDHAVGVLLVHAATRGGGRLRFSIRVPKDGFKSMEANYNVRRPFAQFIAAQLHYGGDWNAVGTEAAQWRGGT